MWIVATGCSVQRNMRNLVAWRLSAVVLTVGFSFLTAAKLIGSSIDSEGFLHEPFFLIGSGSLLVLAGSCVALLLLLIAGIRKMYLQRVP